MFNNILFLYDIIAVQLRTKSNKGCNGSMFESIYGKNFVNTVYHVFLSASLLKKNGFRTFYLWFAVSERFTVK